MTPPINPPDAETSTRCACRGSRTQSGGVTVTVVPRWCPPESSPDPSQHCFAYRVVIYNEKETPVQLLTRFWRIVDAEGIETIVEGEGVIGEQPLIKPGHAFTYTSWCPLPTPWGTMEGRYGMQHADGSSFEVAIDRLYFAVR